MIHPTAVVHPGARLADDVQIGPYTIVGEHVEIGAGTTVGAHSVLTGHTRVGRNNRIFHFVSLGEVPQDKKYGGEDTRLEIGDGNVIREYCSLNVGTALDKGVTRIGNNNWIMAYVHIAHDCTVGNGTVFANCATLAGHVQVGDFAVLGGFTLVHQFARIGAHVMTAMGSACFLDVPPYVTVAGNKARPYGINAEGLRRRGFSAESIERIRRAYKTLYRSGLSLEEARAALARSAASEPELVPLVEFLQQAGRGITR